MRLPSYVLKFRSILYFNTCQVYNCVKGQNDVETDGSTFEKISKPPNLSGGGMEDSKMKRVLSLILAAGLALSLSACGNVLVDLDTPKSSELSAQYDFYPDSMNTIRADIAVLNVRRLQAAFGVQIPHKARRPSRGHALSDQEIINLFFRRFSSQCHL